MVATGPEHSGTGLLADILEEWGIDVIHRAMPHVDDHGCESWWHPDHYPDHRFVVIRRGLIYYGPAARSRGRTREEGVERALRANEYLRRLPAERVTDILYDALVKHPEAELLTLADALGVEYWPYSKTIYDANAKYRL